MVDVAEAPKVAHIDLFRLRAGTVIELHTGNSCYWLTVTNECRPVQKGRIKGVAVHSTNKGFAQTDSPNLLVVDRFVEIGKSFRIGRGITSAVKRVIM